MMFRRTNDMVDLLMPKCEELGYGVQYGRFIAETTPEDRARWANEERERREKKRMEKEQMKGGL